MKLFNYFVRALVAIKLTMVVIIDYNINWFINYINFNQMEFIKAIDKIDTIIITVIITKINMN